MATGALNDSSKMKVSVGARCDGGTVAELECQSLRQCSGCCSNARGTKQFAATSVLKTDWFESVTGQTSWFTSPLG